MPAYDWTTNNHEGRGLRRAFKRLEEKMESARDPKTIAELSKAMAYVAQAKSNIAKNHDLEKRVQELERLAGMAQKAAPIQK